MMKRLIPTAMSSPKQTSGMVVFKGAFDSANGVRKLREGV